MPPHCFHDPAFLRLYFHALVVADAEFSELDELVLSFPLKGNASLEIHTDRENDEHTLYLNHKVCGLAQLGWSDLAAWHPHVFRPEELIAICKYITEVPWNNDLPFLLLHEFCLATNAEEKRILMERSVRAWKSVGVRKSEARKLAEKTVQFTEGNWRRDQSSGYWFVEGEDIYSMRRREVFEKGPEEFPFGPLHRVIEQY